MHFDGKGIQVFFAILVNVHADVGLACRKGWQILGVDSQLEFAVPLGDDVCTCVASVSLGWLNF